MNDVLVNIQCAIAKLTASGADFEVVKETVNGSPADVYKTAPASLRDVYGLCLAHGSKTFIVYQQQRLSFNETYAKASDLAAALAKDFGVVKGDRVAIAMRNNPEWALAFMAITALGAIAVPMNAWWTSEELKYGIEDCGARVLVADEQRVDRVNSFSREMGLSLICVGEDVAANDDGKLFTFAEVINRYPKSMMPTVAIATDDDATILYTSGSSGYPKGVVASHRGILTAMISWVLLGVATTEAGEAHEDAPAAEDAVALLTVPLFHVTGCHSLFLLSILIGRKLVMMYKWDANEALALIEREGITYVNGVPTISQELLDAAESTDRDISSLKELFSGGAARPAEHVRRIAEDFKLNPGSGYGLTETNALGAVNAGKNYIQNPGSVGIPSPAVTEIKIIGESGECVSVGERGEICIKSPANARGYWNRPEATAEAFKNGWFHTGDVGYLDGDGMLFIVDRIKDIIIRGGENISCGEVEAGIYAYPGVAEVAVFSLPDERLGEVCAAVIYMKKDQLVSESELREFLKDQLAAYKIPAHIEFSDSPLLKTATDKIFKREIKEMLVARLHQGDSDPKSTSLA